MAGAGGDPARARHKAGNPGFAGYEYQVEVTIWVALDLMFAKHSGAKIEIEPRSDEDIQAAVEDPSAASLGMQASGERLDLIIQAKTRSGAPWSTSAIADVLLGKESDQEEVSARRKRPLAMLQAAPQYRYLFITNEASTAGLRPHEGEHLFDFPEVDDLPPYTRDGLDEAARAALAPRILLLTGVTLEVLAGRIGVLLSRHGHVPEPRHGDCLSALRAAVRDRIRGEADGHWTRTDVLEVLVRHGGSVAPIRDMDHYVRPKSYDAIKERLNRSHAVVIAGPSGTGKTLTADILEIELRCGMPPFEVVGEEDGPGHVRSRLLRSDPVLFHLRDPWGGNRLTPGADRWSGELPKLLGNAGPGRKFLVTTRSDVLQSAGFELMKELQPYVVSIEVEDYGPARLAKIYDGMTADLAGHAYDLATKHRNCALKTLSRPFELKRFIVALGREDAEERKIEQLLADSQIDAISRVIADQIGPLGADGAMSAAVVWAMLDSRGAVPRNVFVKLARRLRLVDPALRPDVDGLIDFLVAGQNLRQDGPVLAFHHPRVEDGLRMAFMRLARDAERALSGVVDALVGMDRDGEDWGAEAGLGVLRTVTRVEGLELALSQATAGRLDAHLETMALSAERRADFESALRDLQRFGSEVHPPSRLARILIESGLEDEYLSLESWNAPNISEVEIAELRAHGLTQPLIARFVREVLPFSALEYDPKIVALLERLATGLRGAFWDALDTVASPGGPNQNIDVIVTGALAGGEPEYERAIERFAQSHREADAWMKGFREEMYLAEEHAIDADAADHVFDEPGERYFNAEQGMKAVVQLRRQSDGVDWILTSSYRALLVSALAESLAQSSRTPNPGEVRFLLGASDGLGWNQAWRAAQRHWDVALADLLLAELERADIGDVGQRRLLVEIAARNGGGGDPVPNLVVVASRAPVERRLELVYDLLATGLDLDRAVRDGHTARRDRAERLMQGFEEAERELGGALADILGGAEIGAAASSLSADARGLLEATLPRASTDLACPLASLAAAAGIDIDATADRLLSTGDPNDGNAAIHALLISGVPGRRERILKTLDHERYVVRREALRALVPDAEPEERIRIVATAGDRSADVRLAFALLMQEHTWPEAVDVLSDLMEDDRNFGSHASMASSWSRFNVARAAARALEAYETVPAGAVDALLRAAQSASADPFVACAAFSALAKRDDARINSLLSAALLDAGLDGSPSYRPRAQAAAWALCDRATSGRLGGFDRVVTQAAERDKAVVAGPLLVAFGAVGGEARDKLLETLRAARQPDREELVRITSVAIDSVDGMHLVPQEQILRRLARGENVYDLDPGQRSNVEEWSRRLDVSSGFARFLAWIAEVSFRLPLSGEVGKIRAFSLPKSIGVLTIRSLSYYGEENSGPDDGC